MSDAPPPELKQQESPLPPQPGWWQFLTGIFLAALASFVGWIAWRSLGWTYTHDTSVMLYMGLLMESLGKIPYRDFFDMNLPGSYLYFASAGRIFGYEEMGVRLADLTTLGVVMIATTAMMRRFGWTAAFGAALLWALRYLFYGPGMTMQREFVMLIPIALGVAAAISWPRIPLLLRAFLSAAFFAAAMTIKPHAFIGFPPVLVYLLLETERPGWRIRDWTAHLVKVAGAALLGGLVPVSCMFAWMIYHDIVTPFLESTLKYVPLYGKLDGRHVTIEGAARWEYIWNRYQGLGGQKWWIFCALVTVYSAYVAAILRVRHRRRVVLLGTLAAVFSVYPCFSGQFWTYHWLPFVYFLVCCMALPLQPYPPSATWLQRIVPAGFVVYLALFFSGAMNDFHPYDRHDRYVSKSGRSDRIAAYLKKNLEPGDTVQPIDWVGTGVAEGMLKARAPIATPFVYHFHFYHHVSNPFIKEIRKRYVAAFEEAKPRFVVEGKMKRPFVKGKDTSPVFPASDRLLQVHYTKAVDNGGYTIWERKPGDWDTHVAASKSEPASKPPGKIMPERAPRQPSDEAVKERAQEEAQRRQQTTLPPLTLPGDER